MNDLTKLETQDWYKGILEEVSSALTTTYKEARELVLKRTHDLGTELLKYADRFESPTEMSKKIAADVGNLRWWHTVYNAMRIAKQWPNFEDIYKLKDGENISLHKLIHGYLPGTRREKELSTCPVCGSKVNPSRLEN